MSCSGFHASLYLDFLDFGMVSVGSISLWSILHAWDRWEMHTEFWSENVKERDHSEDLCIGREILEWILGT
jgi:hypothetical protein